jgi:hypothetical protein
MSLWRFGVVQVPGPLAGRSTYEALLEKTCARSGWSPIFSKPHEPQKGKLRELGRHVLRFDPQSLSAQWYPVMA